jgi:hypothetical protein
MASVRFIEVQARPTEFLDLVVFQKGYPLKAGHPFEGSFYEGLFVKRN